MTDQPCAPSHLRHGFWAAALPLALILCLGGATEAHAQQKSPGPLALPLEENESVPANWRVKPTSEDLEKAYPTLASTMSLHGAVILACDVEVTGDLSGCRAESETPPGLGFGKAAVGMAAVMKMHPKTVEGRPVKGDVKIPLAFKMSEGPKPPPPLPKVAEPAPSPTAIKLARQVLDQTGAAVRTQAEWDSWLNRRLAEALTDNQPQAAGELVAALRKALELTMAEAKDVQVNALASHMSAEELAETSAFLTTPAGKGFLTALSEGSSQMAPLFSARLYAKAREIFCSGRACGSF